MHDVFTHSVFLKPVFSAALLVSQCEWMQRWSVLLSLSAKLHTDAFAIETNYIWAVKKQASAIS